MSKTYEVKTRLEILTSNDLVDKSCEVYILPDSIKKIDRDAFWRCYALKEIFFVDVNNEVTHNKIEVIGKGAFAETKLKEFIYSPFLKEVGEAAFKNTLLERFVCQDEFGNKDESKIEKIGVRAFCKTQLKEFIYSTYLKEVDDEVFSNTPLERFVCQDGFGNKEESKIEKIGYSAFKETQLKEFVYSPSLRYISYDAFFNVPLEKIDCQDRLGNKEESKIVSIGDGAFYKTRLKEFVYSPSLISVSRNSFKNTPLERFVCQDGFGNLKESKIKWVSPGAFYGTELKEFVYSSSLGLIGEKAFSNTPLERFICQDEFGNPKESMPIDFNAFGETPLSRTLVRDGDYYIPKGNMEEKIDASIKDATVSVIEDFITSDVRQCAIDEITYKLKQIIISLPQDLKKQLVEKYNVVINKYLNNQVSDRGNADILGNKFTFYDMYSNLLALEMEFIDMDENIEAILKIKKLIQQLCKRDYESVKETDLEMLLQSILQESDKLPIFYQEEIICIVRNILVISENYYQKGIHNLFQTNIRLEWGNNLAHSDDMNALKDKMVKLLTMLQSFEVKGAIEIENIMSSFKQERLPNARGIEECLKNTNYIMSYFEEKGFKLEKQTLEKIYQIYSDKLRETIIDLLEGKQKQKVLMSDLKNLISGVTDFFVKIMPIFEFFLKKDDKLLEVVDVRRFYLTEYKSVVKKDSVTLQIILDILKIKSSLNDEDNLVIDMKVKQILEEVLIRLEQATNEEELNEEMKKLHQKLLDIYILASNYESYNREKIKVKLMYV